MDNKFRKIINEEKKDTDMYFRVVEHAESNCSDGAEEYKDEINKIALELEKENPIIEVEIMSYRGNFEKQKSGKRNNIILKRRSVTFDSTYERMLAELKFTKLNAFSRRDIKTLMVEVFDGCNHKDKFTRKVVDAYYDSEYDFYVVTWEREG